VSDPGIVVVGSINRDYVCRVASLPRPGETVLGSELTLGSGGKGGNQAVAVARMGVRCAMVGCVGDDADGRTLLRSLQAQGVDVSRVLVDAGSSTGAAFVFVEPSGENSIVVVPGANARLPADRTRSVVLETLSAEDLLVVQAEISSEALVAAVEAAAQMGARVVLNLAPFRRLPDAVVSHCDPLVVNGSEAQALLGLPHGGDVDGSGLAVSLRERARSAVVTLGGDGAVVAFEDRVELVEAEHVRVVDSTGAGDAFTGVLAARLVRGADLLSAVRLGVAAGTYAVQRAGAQASYPALSHLEAAARQTRGG
jgi:ribokinase